MVNYTGFEGTYSLGKDNDTSGKYSFALGYTSFVKQSEEKIREEKRLFREKKLKRIMNK